MCLNCTRFYCSLEYVKLWEEAQDEQSNTLDGSQGMKLFIIICVCVYFLFLGLQYACPSIYFYWKALLFRKLQVCKYYLWKNGWKQLQSIFMKRKWNILWHEVLGFFGKWRDQSAQLRSNLLSYIKLKFFYIVFFSQLCMYIWSFVQLAYLLKLIFWKIWILL